MLKSLILLLLLLTIPSFAETSNWEVTPPSNLQTQMDINTWAAPEFERADIELNKVKLGN